MSKQINIGIVTNDNEVQTPPNGYVAIYKKQINGNITEYLKDSTGAIFTVVAGVNDVDGNGGSVTASQLVTSCESVINKNFMTDEEKIKLANQPNYLPKITLNTDFQQQTPNTTHTDLQGLDAVLEANKTYKIKWTLIISQPVVSTSYETFFKFKGTNGVTGSFSMYGAYRGYNYFSDIVNSNSGIGIRCYNNRTSTDTSENPRKGVYMFEGIVQTTNNPSIVNMTLRSENTNINARMTIHKGSTVRIEEL